MFFLLLFIGCGGRGGGDDGGSSGSNSGDSTDTTGNTEPLHTQIDFQDTVLDHYQEQTLSVRNKGSTNVTIKSVAQSYPLADPFLITDDRCSGATLAPSRTCTVTVRFAPTDQGTFTDTFDIKSDSGQTIMLVDVSGTSVGLNVSTNRIDTSLFPTVRVFVRVTDRDDEPVDSFPVGDFRIFENGVQKSIDSFSNTITAPVSVALALDSSGSIQADLPKIEDAAKSFIDQLSISPGTDETGGQYFVAPTSDDLQGIYTQIAYILTHQYVIEYQSSASDGDINLAVEVSDNSLSGSDEKTVTGGS